MHTLDTKHFYYKLKIFPDYSKEHTCKGDVQDREMYGQPHSQLGTVYWSMIILIQLHKGIKVLWLFNYFK